MYAHVAQLTIVQLRYYYIHDTIFTPHDTVLWQRNCDTGRASLPPITKRTTGIVDEPDSRRFGFRPGGWVGAKSIGAERRLARRRRQARLER